MHNPTHHPAKQLSDDELWRETRSRWARGALAVAASAVTVLGAAGCSLDSLLQSDQLPPEVSDPALSQTPQGARIAYNGTLSQFGHVFGGKEAPIAFVATTGVLSDELMAHTTNMNPIGGQSRPLDQRVDGGPNLSNSYADLQKVRGQASQAIGLLADFLPEEPALRGHLYAVQGYTELFLAELFCSGVPLSTLDYRGDYTYRPGSSTAEIFTHAAALFDTALALGGDSTRFVQLAQVGRARALLALRRYADAAAQVAVVPDAYRYHLAYSTQQTTQTVTGLAQWINFFFVSPGAAGSAADPGEWLFTVPDREGVHGMDWRTSGDPRTSVTLFGDVYYPDHRATDGSSPLMLASGVEARLIEAEAALQANPDDGVWLHKLNALRTDSTFEVTGTTPPDTLWHAGSGGVAGLEPLADPNTSEGRVDLVFRERAFWLFLTGHRQGDLRRLIRQYDRNPADVYPSGAYLLDGFYGSVVTLPVPVSEALNPLFTGCFSRGA